MPPIKRTIQQIIESFEAPIKKDFAELKSDASRVNFVYDLLTFRDLLPQPHWLTIPKNSKVCLTSVEQARNYAQIKDNLNALKAYNKALCFASDGQTKAEIYRARSQIYWSMNYYMFCVENIDLALNGNWSDLLKEKMQKRKTECLDLIKNGKDEFVNFGNAETSDVQLSYAASKTIPCAVECLSIGQNKSFGKHIFTRKDLHPGDVLMIEKPFSAVLNKNSTYSHCTHCLKNNFFNLKPCLYTTSAMFCSDKCYNEAWTRYYQFEHKIMHGIYEILDCEVVAHALRLTLKSFTMLDQPESLLAFIKLMKQNPKNKNGVNLKSSEEAKTFFEIYQKLTHANCVSIEGNLEDSTYVAIAYYMVLQTQMIEMLRNAEIQDLFKEIMMKLIKILQINGQETSNTLMEVKGTVEPHVNGNGIFLIQSLLNHSCVPNVTRVALPNGANCVIAIRPITGLSQLFDSYGIRHVDAPKVQRQAFLRSNYFFDCKCNGCIMNYPQWAALSMRGILSPTISNCMKKYNFSSPITEIDKNLLEMRKNVVSLLEKSNHVYPCMDLVLLQATLIDCIQIGAFKKSLNTLLQSKKNQSISDFK